MSPTEAMKMLIHELSTMCIPQPILCADTDNHRCECKWLGVHRTAAQPNTNRKG